MSEVELFEIRNWLFKLMHESRKVYQQEAVKFTLSGKNHQDFVTSLDLNLQKFISNEISEKYPNHVILAEEDAPDEISLDGIVWIVDPLDGTVNFINNIPIFNISISMLINGMPHIAAVYDLIHNELFQAVLGYGATLNSSSINLQQIKRESDFIAVSTGVLDLIYDSEVGSFKKLRKLGKIRILGSQALQLCYVACGRLRANISVEAKICDDSAGSLILREAGGSYKSLVSGDIVFLNENFATLQDQYSIGTSNNLSQELFIWFSRLVRAQ